MITKGLEEFDIDPFEYSHIIETVHVDDGYFKMYIPKLMPNIARKSPTKTTMTFNNNMFLNDSSCKPATSTRVNTQNYLTVKRQYNRSFWARANEHGYIASGTRFIIQVMYENVRDMRVVDVSS